MARPKNSKVIKCPNKRCEGKIVAMVGAKGKCSHCGTEVRFTKKLLRSLGKIV